MTLAAQPFTPIDCSSPGCNKRFRSESDLNEHEVQFNNAGECLCSDCRRYMSDDEIELWEER